MNLSVTFGLVADDFTGAMDTGVKFVAAGLTTKLLLDPTYSETAQVHVINTNSRDTDVKTAKQRVVEAAHVLRGRRIFKKIDSTMRGHVAPEIVALLAATGLTKAVVCPAVIEAGRTVLNGTLWVNGVPLSESDFIHDPHWPATTSNVIRLIGAPATHIPLGVVRAGPARLCQAITDAPTQIVGVDAANDSDLDVISQAVVLGDFLPCGAIGLAKAWIRQLAVRQNRQHLEPLVAGPNTHTSPWLVIAGSRHPVTTAQVASLITQRDLAVIELGVEPNTILNDKFKQVAASFSAGRSVVIRLPPNALIPAPHLRAIKAVLQEMIPRICRDFEPGGFVLTGGETANAICQSLNTESVQILGELEAVIPWGKLVGGVASGLPIVTKGGGVGHENTLIDVVDMLRTAD